MPTVVIDATGSLKAINKASGVIRAVIEMTN
jgi:hypothetical protein